MQVVVAEGLDSPPLFEILIGIMAGRNQLGPILSSSGTISGYHRTILAKEHHEPIR